MSLREDLADMGYGPAPVDAGRVRAWLDRYEAGFGHLVAGVFRESGETFAVRDPARGDILARVTRGTAADADTAVAAARAAQAGWAALEGFERGRHLRALAEALGRRAEFLAVLESLQHGIPAGASAEAVARSVGQIRDLADAADAQDCGTPWGVCAALVAPSRPLAALTRRIAPPLAAGNAMVLVPGSEAPLTALALAEIWCEAGLPDGVVNVLGGDAETARALAAHPGIDRIAVAGPAETRRMMARASAGNGTGLAADPGGRALFLVFGDADLDAAVEGVVEAAWGGRGDAGVAGIRVLVAEAAEAGFVERLEARMGRAMVGDPLDRNSEVGVTVRPERLEAIRRLLEDGRSEGAILREAGNEGRSLILATDVAPANPLWAAETLEGVVTVTSFRTPREALHLAEYAPETPVAAVWSENVNLCLEAAAGVTAPLLRINSAGPLAGEEADADAAAGWLRPVAAAESASSGAEPRPAAVVRAEAEEAVRRTVAAAEGAGASAPDRAAALRGLAERLSVSRAEAVLRLVEGGAAKAAAEREVETAIRRARWYAARASRPTGTAELPAPSRLVWRLGAPVGLVGVVGPAAWPLLGPLSLALPALALGNRVVVATAVTAAVPVLRDSFGGAGLPAGAACLVTGDREALAAALARHGGVGAVWSVGAAAEAVETACAHCLKQVWTEAEGGRDWAEPAGQGLEFLDRATRWKTVRFAYGA